MTNYSFIHKYVEAYLCSSYYFDDYINGRMLAYLFKGESATFYTFKLESYEIKQFKEYTNVPEEFIKRFDGLSERHVIHLVCSFTSNTTIETTITKYNLYISKKKFYKFVRNKIKNNHESKY